MPPCLLVIVIASLVLIIRNSFEVSMNARIHQFGILPSIGASPGQIRICLMQEAAVLTVLPMILGSLAGILISWGLMGAVNYFAADVSGRREPVFHYHPAVLAVTMVSVVLIVLFSAWIPAGKLSRMTPLEAIRSAGSVPLMKKKHSRMFTTLSSISTRYTYFEKYQDAWDIMLTLKDTEIADFHLTKELEKVSGIQEVTVSPSFR